MTQQSDREFTPEEIELSEKDAAEAERGYTAEALASKPTRVYRRPTVGDDVAVVVPVRLDPDRLRAIDARASAARVTRSRVIRDAIDRELAAT
jgi:hypothetical protein